MLRFIAVCIAVTFVFVMAIPVLQITALFEKDSRLTEIAVQDAQDAIDPFAVFANNEPSAEMLNAIEPAAGSITDSSDDFGTPFFENDHPSFTDHVTETVIIESEELDL